MMRVSCPYDEPVFQQADEFSDVQMPCAEEANDFDGQATAGPDVFCGFGGDDSISTLDAGDIFIGGAGNDSDLVSSATGTAVSEISDGPTDKSTAHPAEKSALSSIDTSTLPSRKT